MISIVLLMIFWHDDYRVPAVASEMVHSWIYSGRKTSLDLSFEVDHHLQLNFGGIQSNLGSAIFRLL